MIHIETIDKKYRGVDYKIEVLLDEAPQNPFEELDGMCEFHWYRDGEDFIQLVRENPNAVAIDVYEHGGYCFSVNEPGTEYLLNLVKYEDEQEMIEQKRLEAIKELHMEYYNNPTTIVELEESEAEINENNFGYTMEEPTRPERRGCRWDASSIGMLWVPCEEQNEEIKRLTINAKYILAERDMKLYEDYVNGHVYGYTVEAVKGEEGKLLGFYGNDHEKSGLLEYAVNSAECAINNLIKKTEK